MKNLFAVFAVLLLAFVSCGKAPPDVQPEYVRVQEGRFAIGGRAYSFIGTNFWFGAILGSKGEGGDRDRLVRELDLMKSLGINNLRVLVGADGYPGRESRVGPALQLEPGVYNDTIFDGLDFLMDELGKRKMYAVLYLNNSWDWSGGYAQYLEWAGVSAAAGKGARDRPEFVRLVKNYAVCDACKAMFFRHITRVLGRINRYSGLRYVDDPALMAWQVGNEPRAFSESGKWAFAEWLAEAAALIRSLDGNHLISIGSEGSMGCENDLKFYETIHADPNIDYLTIHIWPKNRRWITDKNVAGALDAAIEKTDAYLLEHLSVAERLKKPLVVEEFGFPRDHHLYSPTDSTALRDRYYKNLFEHVLASHRGQGFLAGCNFWGWGGFGRPAHLHWQPWDPYLGDPSQEEQGLHSVFDTDATLGLILEYNFKLKSK